MARKDMHRDNIIRTAMRLFRRQGFAGTGLQQIVDESGAPKGSLYHYFPDGKEALAEAAVDLAGDLVGEMLQQTLDRTRTLRTFLNGVADTYAAWMTEGQFASGCPIATTMLECAPDSHPISSAGAKAFGRWISIVAAAFERDGYDEAAARRMAEAFVAAIEGALILSRVRKSAEPLRNVAKSFPLSQT